MKRLAIVLLALPISVTAEPLVYDESIDGDIQDLPELVFGFGANTVSGTVYNYDEGYDFDKFKALLPEFSVLDSVTLIQTDANGSGIFPNSFEAYLDPHWADIVDGYQPAAGEFVWTHGKLTTYLDFVGHNALIPNMEVDYTLVFNVSRTTVPSTLAVLGDINGDRSQDIAALTKDIDALNATVKNAEDPRLVNTVDFSSNQLPLDLEVMPDINGNGAPELVVLGQAPNGYREAIAEVQDSRSDEMLGFIYYGPASPIDLELVADQTANGIPEVAMLQGRNSEVKVIDPRTRNTVNTLKFNEFDGKDLSVWSRGDRVSVGVLGESKDPTRSDKVEIRDLETGKVVKNLWVGKTWNLLQMELVGDLNGNGSPELAILREHPDDQSVSVQIVDTVSGTRFKHLGFDPDYRPVRLRVLNDINGNGSGEVAVLAVRRGCCNQKVWVKDARTGQSIQQVFFGKQFIGEDLGVSPDINGNGTPELVVLGRREDGELSAIIKDSKTGQFVSSVGF